MSKQTKPQIEITSYTNKGPVREQNEDAVFCYTTYTATISADTNMTAPETEKFTLNNNEKIAFFIVIDGMGGYEGGKEAAGIVAQTFKTFTQIQQDQQNPREKIYEILNKASENIKHEAEKKPELSSMGAALAGIAIHQGRAFAFNCGDCRVYRKLKDTDGLEKLSHDHSAVQKLFDKRRITEEKMRTHRRRNILTAWISSNPMTYDLFFREIPQYQSPQKFLVCSDGVWEALPPEEIENCLASKTALDAANELVRKLTQLGDKCSDNVSFLIINFLDC